MAEGGPPASDQRGSNVLSKESCLELLRSARGVGRLGFLLASRIVILPLNFVVVGSEVLLRIGPGSLLTALADDPPVSFQVDRVTTTDAGAPEGWSVLLHGVARLVRDPVELAETTALGLTPSVPEPGLVYVKIEPVELSGRRFDISGLGRFALEGPSRVDAGSPGRAPLRRGSSCDDHLLNWESGASYPHR